MTTREGDPGTWSHCGSIRPHGPHKHDIVFNEGPYRGVTCNGTPGAPPKTWHNMVGILVNIERTQVTTQEEGEEEEGMNRSEVIRSRVASLEKELALVEQVEGKVALEDGTMVKYDRRLGRGDEADLFMYLAIRAGGRWYTTGSHPSDAIKSDDAFINLLAHERTVNVELLQAGEKIK